MLVSSGCLSETQGIRTGWGAPCRVGVLCTHPGVAPGSDALPAEEVPTGGGCAVPPLLQAQRAARLAPRGRLLAPASN